MIENKNAQAEYLRAENEMLRLQLALKTKEVEAEENQRIKLELDLKTKEMKSLWKQIGELRAENDKCNKTVSCIQDCKLLMPRFSTLGKALGLRYWINGLLL